MADTVCRRCGASIDPRADPCPECGAPDPVSPAEATPPGVPLSPERGATPADAAPQPEAAAPEPRPSTPSTPATPSPAAPARRTVGARLSYALRAIGCLVIAGLALLIAIAVGLLDFLF